MSTGPSWVAPEWFGRDLLVRTYTGEGDDGPAHEEQVLVRVQVVEEKRSLRRTDRGHEQTVETRLRVPLTVTTHDVEDPAIRRGDVEAMALLTLDSLVELDGARSSVTGLRPRPRYLEVETTT